MIHVRSISIIFTTSWTALCPKYCSNRAILYSSIQWLHACTFMTCRYIKSQLATLFPYFLLSQNGYVIYNSFFFRQLRKSLFHFLPLHCKLYQLLAFFAINKWNRVYQSPTTMHAHKFSHCKCVCMCACVFYLEFNVKDVCQEKNVTVGIFWCENGNIFLLLCIPNGDFFYTYSTTNGVIYRYFAYMQFLRISQLQSGIC